jgi:hypothetical protein
MYCGVPKNPCRFLREAAEGVLAESAVMALRVAMFAQYRRG